MCGTTIRNWLLPTEEESKVGISTERFDRHQASWTSRFTNYKAKWPKYLFRHEPIEGALGVLTSGRLLSRNSATAEDCIANDIAPTEIIGNRDVAHNFARLYFRPRTPTQFHIEGIRKPADYYRGRHGGLLVMLAFDAKSVLTMPSTKFSDGNMQSGASSVLDGDVGFDSLDFLGIYHDEANPTDDQKRKRCAEVLAESPLHVAENLSAIVVRTDADATTVKYLLDQRGLSHFAAIVKKSEGIGVFFHHYTALQFVDFAPNKIRFKLASTRSGNSVDVRISAKTPDGSDVQIFNGSLKPLTPYFVNHTLPSGVNTITFHLEGCFAYSSSVDTSIV